MKIKLTSFQVYPGKYELDFYGVKIGGVYEVARHYETGGVSVMTPSGKELPLFSSEFEYIMEA